MAKENLVGEQIGQWEVLEDLGIRSFSSATRMFKARCVNCGYIRERISKYEMLKFIPCTKHRRGRWANTKLKFAFENMKARCYSPTAKGYAMYGAKGIKVCDEWLTNPQAFEAWCLEHGYQDGLIIDRIDVTKDYSPENCRIVTRAQAEVHRQFQNPVGVYEYNGSYMNIYELSRILTNNPKTLSNYRMANGYKKTLELIDHLKKDPNYEIPNNQERRITVNGERMSLSAWERQLGVEDTHYLIHFAKRHTDDEVAERIDDLLNGRVKINKKKAIYKFIIHGNLLSMDDIAKIASASDLQEATAWWNKVIPVEKVLAYMKDRKS